MSLERKPQTHEPTPEYPDAQEYAADRRKFLGTIGTLAVGAAGLWALRRMTSVAEDGPNRPQVAPKGDVAPVQPAAPAPGNLKIAPRQNTPPAQPTVSPAGGMQPVVPRSNVPPRAEPQGRPEGARMAPKAP